MKHVLAAVLFAVVAQSAAAATFNVTNTNDSGAGSLRDAIAQANASPGPDTITFSVTGTITLTTGQIQISDALTITGPGAGSLAIDGNNSSRIFSIFATDPACPAVDGPDYVVSISGLTLRNARLTFANTGGAIFSEHSLYLDQMIIENNVAARGAGVGVQIQYDEQQTQITNSIVRFNTAKPVLAGTTFALGGGVAFFERCSGTHTPDDVYISDTVIVGNRVQPTTGNGDGGGIWTDSYADVTVRNSRVVSNKIDVPNPPAGGIFYQGGGISAAAKSLTLQGAEVSDNDIIDATNGDVTRGGGIRAIYNAADLQAPIDAMSLDISNSTISGNHSSATSAAVHVFGNVAVSIRNSTIANNVGAPGRTGGIVMTTGATNPSSGSNATAPTLTLASTILADNLGSDLSTNVATIPTFTVNADHSMIENICPNPTCVITVTGGNNQLGVDPKLGALTFNGGTTRTQSLLPGSPAIDSGSNPNGLITDQRNVGYARVNGGTADIGAFETGNPLDTSGFTPGTTYVTSAQNSAPTGVATLTVQCPANGILVITGSGESAAQSRINGTAFVGLAYSIARDDAATDNSNVVQSSALATFNGDTNRDFLNVRRVDSCTPSQTYTYFLTAYATNNVSTATGNRSFVWNGRLTAVPGPADSALAAGTTYVTSASNASPTIVATLGVTCPASGQVLVDGSGESASVSNSASLAFIGLAYSISRNSFGTDNTNVVQSSALGQFNGDANRDFLNVQRFDSCTPGQVATYYLTAYATTPQTNTSNASFVWNGRLTAFELPVATSLSAGATPVASSSNATPTIVTTLNITCPASGNVVITGSGESTAKSNFAGNAFIGLAYSIARDSMATDNANVVQSSALAVFNGDANRDFLNVQRSDACTPGQGYNYYLTTYATTPQTATGGGGSFVFNGRLAAIMLP